MASTIANNFNTIFNELFKSLEPINVGNVPIPQLKLDSTEEKIVKLVEDEVSEEETKQEPVEDKITCPVKVKSAVERIAKINVTGHPEVKPKTEEKSEVVERDEVIDSIVTDLTNIGIKFTNVRRSHSGLIELDLILNTGALCTISIDAEGRLYNDDVRIFFIGKVNPGDEYVMLSFVFAAESIRSIFNGVPIPENFCVPADRMALNRMLDIRTLKETDKSKRKKTLVKAGKVFEAMNDDIVKAADGEPFRFAIAKYQSEQHFSLVSSKRNVVSNLSDNKLLATKEIWIEVDNKNVKLYTK